MAAAFGLYCLAGFFLLPLLARPQIEKRASEQLRGRMTIKQMTFNPLKFSASLKDTLIVDSERKRALSVGEVVADLIPLKILWGKARVKSLTLRDCELVDPADQEQTLKLPRLQLSGLEYDWRTNSLHLASLISSGGDTKLVMAADGAFNIPTILKERVLKPAKPEAETPPGGPANRFTLKADSLALQAHTFSFENKSAALGGKWEFEKVNFQGKNFTLEQKHRSQVDLSFTGKQGGSVEIHGDFSVLPAAFALKADLHEIPLKTANSLLTAANLHFDSGALTAQLELQVSLEAGVNLNVRGDTEVNEPALLRNDLSQPLFTAAKVALRSALVKGLPFEFNAEELLMIKPALYYQVAGAAPAKQPLSEPKGEAPSPAPLVSLRGIRLQEGAVTISDQGTKPAVELKLSDLTAEIKDASLRGTNPMRVKSRAKIFGEGLIVLDGHLIPARFPANLEAALKIERMPLNPLSPYAAKFLGREVSSGKLSAELSAQAKAGDLHGSNKFVLHHFDLGKSVPSKDALDVPLGTVLALLRDQNGNITLDVPVEGQTTDPAFRYRDLVFKTLLNDLVSLAASPVTMLGSLYDWQGGSLEEIAFDVASAKLPESEAKKLEVIAKALRERPALELEIQAGSAPAEFKPDPEQPAPLEKLSVLANERAKLIKQTLEAAGVSPGRLFLAEIALDRDIEDNRVGSKLKLLFGESGKL